MISGLQKMTLLDFPGKIACTVFLHGCNYRCPFCHNSELLAGKPEPLMDEESFFKFLKSRQGLLDGVCVSGGEPTLQPNLGTFLKRIKDLGFSVKLDTNGSRPAVLKALVEQGLVDYVAMDIKNSPSQYGQTIGKETPDLSGIEESVHFLSEGKVGYEFRTTVVEQLHSEESIVQMGKWLREITGGKAQKLYLQRFVDRDTVMFSGLSAPNDEKMVRFQEVLRPYIQYVAIRGED